MRTDTVRPERMGDIAVEDVVAGDYHGWWEVTRVETLSTGSVMLTAIDKGAGMQGFLFGTPTDLREVRHRPEQVEHAGARLDEKEETGWC